MNRLFLAVMLFVVLAAPAQAGTAVSIQNDAWMLNCDSSHLDAEMDRANEIHAKWVRIMVSETRWPSQKACIKLAAAALHNPDGKYHAHVLVTLMAWRTHPTAAEWANFTASVVAELAPYADAWSLMNEPNHPYFMAATPESCATTTGDPTSWAYTVVVRQRIKHQHKWRFKRLKRGHGNYTRHWRRGRHGQHGHWVYTRVHGKARKHAHWLRVRVHHHRTRRQVVRGTSPGRVIRQCQAIASGTAYHRVWDAAAHIIRDVSNAPMCVGDLAPSAFGRDFMEAFYETGAPVVTPNMLCIHPYERNDPSKPDPGLAWNVSGIYSAAAYAKAHGLTLWVTEWAYWPNQPASWWPIAMSRMRDAGVQVISIYDASGPTWDTFMRPDALAAVAAWPATG
jgi:hypothetical protein